MEEAVSEKRTTSGPWVARRYGGSIDDSWYVRGANDQPICGQGSGPVRGVHAILIAAAPDLLEIARQSLKWAMTSKAHRSDRGWGTEEEDEWIATAKAVIARATGAS